MSEAATTISDRQMANHDVINCLASVRSLAELLADYPKLGTDDCIRFLSIIRAETDRLADLLANLKSTPEHALPNDMAMADKLPPTTASSETP